MEEINTRLENLINNIQSGQPLSKAEYEMLRNSSKNIKDSSAYYNKCKHQIFKMVNQHSNFHIFRTESYNTSNWPI